MSKITFFCSNVDDIFNGTEVISAIGNFGIITEIGINMRDCDGNYGVGYIVLWEHGGTSQIPKYDITLNFKDKFQFKQRVV